MVVLVRIYGARIVPDTIVIDVNVGVIIIVVAKVVCVGVVVVCVGYF
ncbi:MAG: hypothetical protein C5S38_02070 [Candidatus Methanophagaceae archaeon]|nr:MAG: hypothetical protein C5S38_02070 [Methanophagales archaeon]